MGKGATDPVAAAKDGDGFGAAANIDMRKGLLWQIYTLTRKSGAERLCRDDYVRWVHTPYYYKEEPKHMRFFDNEVLEMFSKVRPGVPLGCICCLCVECGQ